MKKNIKGITSFKLAPYNRGIELVVFIGLSKKEILKELSKNSHILNFESKDKDVISFLKKGIKKIKKDVDFSILQNFEKSYVTEGLFYNFHKELNFFLIVLPEINIKRLEDKNYLIELQITISHELMHLSQKFLKLFFDRNIEIEAEAYFHDNLTRQIMNEILNNNLDINL